MIYFDLRKKQLGKVHVFRKRSFIPKISFNLYRQHLKRNSRQRVPLLVIFRAILKIMMVAVDYEINVCIRILACRNMRHSSNKHLEKKLGQMINYHCVRFFISVTPEVYFGQFRGQQRIIALPREIRSLEYIYNSILGYEGNYILRLKRKPVRVYDKTVSCSNL